MVKNDAERSVKHLAGVTQVIDNIRVLPLSTFDNRIRVAEYRTIYGFGGLVSLRDGYPAVDSYHRG